MNHDIFQSKLLIISVIFLFILLISSDVLPKSNVSAQRDVDRLIREGKELYKNGEYREAIVKFLEAKDLARTREEISDVYFNLSSAYYASNQSVEAREHLRKSLEVLPERTIDALYYSADFVEMFNETKAELIKLKEKEKRPVVKAKPAVEKKVKKGGGGLLIVLGVLVIGGAAAALLLMGKKGNGGGNGEAPGPTTGSIQVNSSPTGAQVFLDGSDTGSTTNTTLTNVSPGSHTVSLIMEGYEDEQASVSVTAGQTATVSVTLTEPTITVIELPTNTVWRTGEGVEIKWETSGSGASQGVVSTGAGLNSSINQGRNVLFPFQRRAFQERRFLRSAIKERRSLEDVDSSGNRGKLSSNTSEPQGISGEISSSVKEGDIVHKRAKDIRYIKRNSRVGIINSPVVPQLSSSKFMPSGDIRVLALSYVKIDLYKGSIFNQTIVSSTENDGSYLWTVDPSLEDGTDYKVRISNPNDSTSYGESEEFEIRSFQDIEWVQIPAGNFQMGDNFNEGYSNELPVHTVYLDAYYISKYEVTFEQYDAFCDATGRSKPSDKDWGRGDRPVIYVTWNDAKAFCDWMSGETGENTHLPTEAQWEKAARGTDQRRYPWGSGSPTSSLANYNNYVGETMPVGSYPAGVSSYGIHDMAGNVYELCSDWYDANYYSSSPTDNPQGPSSGSSRVMRGGDLSREALDIRSSIRYFGEPSIIYTNTGFRVCKDVSVAKSITVTEPTSSTIWTKGQSADITWTSTGAISNVKIDLYKGITFEETIISSTENDGTYTWTEVNSTLADGTDYKVRVSSTTDSGLYGESDAFTIEGKSITVTEPTSSTVWSQGNPADITWTSTGAISNVKIDLYKGITFKETIISSTENDGTYTWTEVNSTLADGTDYKVRVLSTTDSGLFDESDAFTIEGKSITVTSPTSGDIWSTGQSVNITWTSTGTISYYVDLDIYKGTTRVAYAHSTENDGIFPWVVDSFFVEGTDYKIRISDETDASIYGESGIFTINQGYEYVSQWGSYGTGNSLFDYPVRIATDSSGNVYVVDLDNHRIQKFTSSGGYLTQWGSYGSGDGQFDNPYGIAVDSSGYVYVADYWNYRIQKFTSDGVFVTKWGSYGTGDGQFDDPLGVAVDSSGNVYVVEGNNNRIQKFTSNGTFLTKWGSYGTGDGQFNNPYGIAVDSSGNVYVTEEHNHRVQKFTSSGAYLTQWGSYGSEDGQFYDPLGVAVDSNGNIFVADTRNYRIQKFRSDGTFVTKWGSYGSEDGEVDWPYGIAVDSSGYVYVADTYNDRIQKFQPIATSSSLTLNNPRIIKSNLGTIKSSKTRPNKSRPPLTRRPRTTRNKK